MTNLKQRVLQSTVSVIGTNVIVGQVLSLSPHLRCIRVEGDPITQISWSPGDKVKLHIGEGLMRSYTPARVDREAGAMDIIVHLHGNGPASQWARSLRGGERITFMGPAKSMPAGMDEHTPWAVFLGDETTVGLAVALVESCPPGTEIIGAIELHPDDLHVVDALGLPLQAVPRDGDHGGALLEWLAQTWVPPGDGVAWISGEASAVVELRAGLLKRGVPREQVRIKPYWSVRGTAYRKQLERSALVA